MIATTLRNSRKQTYSATTHTSIRLLWCVIFGILATACSPSQTTMPAQTTTRITDTTTRIPIATKQPFISSTEVAAPTNNPSTTANWILLPWEGLHIAVPPFAELTPMDAHTSNTSAPVLASAAITYPAVEQHVEKPFGPIFQIVRFPGTIDEWIIHIQQESPMSVEARTIRDITLAGRSGKRYQPVVTGACNMAQYVFKLDTERLVLITNECLEQEPYESIIKQVQVAE